MGWREGGRIREEGMDRGRQVMWEEEMGKKSKDSILNGLNEGKAEE